jgi:hypothetical protein
MTVEHVELKVHPANENVDEKDALTTYLKLKFHHTGKASVVNVRVDLSGSYCRNCTVTWGRGVK